MKIEYIKQVDYLIPNLKVNEQKNINIGKYGLLRLNYLKQHNKSLYTTLLMKDKLTDYLISVDKECNDKFNLLIKQYKETITKIDDEYINAILKRIILDEEFHIQILMNFYTKYVK